MSSTVTYAPERLSAPPATMRSKARTASVTVAKPRSIIEGSSA
jgi:hypothetical protein